MIISKSLIREIVQQTVLEGYGRNLGVMTPEEQRSVALMKKKINYKIREYWGDLEDARNTIEAYTQYREQEEAREIDPYDYNAEPKDLGRIDRIIEKAQDSLDGDTGVFSVEFPEHSEFWRNVSVKPRVIKAISHWLANEMKLNGRWMSNELLSIDTTRKPGQRSSRRKVEK